MAFARLGTKIGGAFGTVERTACDRKVTDGVNRMELSKDQLGKILDRMHDLTQNVGGLTKNEKLGQSLKQTGSIFGGSSKAAPTLNALGDAMTKIGQEDRQLEKRQNEHFKVPLESFGKDAFVAFMKEKKVLDQKALDMDGARDKNKKSPNDENALAEKEATLSYQNQMQTVETLIGQMTVHYNVQQCAIKAFAQIRSEYHANCAKILQSALSSMNF